MPLAIRNVRRRVGDTSGFDADAAAYIRAVQSADGAALEPAVAWAINAFVLGCKADGIWSALKASCILMGARTLSGALTPLVGTAPTNFNFVSGDYNRETGLAGNSSTKYLDTNRATNADPQNSAHAVIYLHTRNSQIATLIGAASSGSDRTLIRHSSDIVVTALRSATATKTQSGAGLLGISRAASGSYSRRIAGTTDTVTATSTTPNSLAMTVLARRATASTIDEYSGSRAQFYSLGESLDLSLLDSRVATLVSDIAAAIP